MPIPLFSIIIPTRNRYETLQYSILTVLNQDLHDFELIISDNSDPDYDFQKTILDEYSKDERIKIIRPLSVLPMSEHWEFAVSNANGEYIIIFGDDDGLVAGALSAISTIIHKSKADLISWTRVEYNWPDSVPSENSNQLIIPYTRLTGVIDSKTYIKKVISYEADYRYLPMLYNSAVSKRLLNQLKNKTGKVFNASSPDIYTGYAFAHLLKKYISIGYPLSINGVSSKSNGAAHINGDEKVKEDYWKLQNKSSIKWPETLPEIYTSYLGIIEPFIQLAHFYPELNVYISRKKIFKLIIDHFEYRDRQDMELKITAFLKFIKSDKYLDHLFSEVIKKIPYKDQLNNTNKLENRVGFNGYHLVLDGSKFGLRNVNDVSIFIHNLFGTIKEGDVRKSIHQNLFLRIKRAGGMVLKGI